eukprot:4073407-Alexandrium_andersonii.AAC.1
MFRVESVGPIVPPIPLGTCARCQGYANMVGVPRGIGGASRPTDFVRYSVCFQPVESLVSPIRFDT